jgi:hypothetical protein
MLQQMKKRGHIKTVPLAAGKKQKSFGYQLPNNSAPSPVAESTIPAAS